MKKINDNRVFYIYLCVVYLFSLWLSLFLISDLKIIYLLISGLVIIFSSVGQMTYIILSYPSLYQLNDVLIIKRLFKVSSKIKLKDIISLEEAKSILFIRPPGTRTFIKKYMMVVRDNGNETSFFYDCFSDGNNISEFAKEIKNENPFFRDELIN